MHGCLPHVGFYDRIFRLDILWRAWKEVRVNKGSAGIDGITFEIIEEYGVEEYLLDIQEEIKHRPDPIEEPACQKGMQKCAVAYYFNLLISLSISDGETRPIDLDNTSPRLK